ncbi:MAG: hypothetical protein WD068_02250 [Candidatus Babeliales bacterium]
MKKIVLSLIVLVSMPILAQETETMDANEPCKTMPKDDCCQEECTKKMDASEPCKTMPKDDCCQKECTKKMDYKEADCQACTTTRAMKKCEKEPKKAAVVMAVTKKAMDDNCKSAQQEETAAE